MRHRRATWTRRLSPGGRPISPRFAPRQTGRTSPSEPTRKKSGRTHKVQGWLRDLGKSLGFEVWIAINDRGRPYDGGRLCDGCRDSLPGAIENARAAEAIRLIDVLWIEAGTGRVAAAFEVEHSTSIHSGIVRMLDLALGLPDQQSHALFIVAPEAREKDVREQALRPAFSRVADLQVRFISYGDLASHRGGMARFGQGMKAIEAIARRLS